MGRPTDAEIGEQEMAMYRRAGLIAQIAMGRECVQRRRGYNPAPEWNAELDPLAYWSLIDLLIGFAARHGHAAKRMQGKEPT
jgi:hypothetical protein